MRSLSELSKIYLPRSLIEREALNGQHSPIDWESLWNISSYFLFHSVNLLDVDFGLYGIDWPFTGTIGHSRVCVDEAAVGPSAMEEYLNSSWSCVSRKRRMYSISYGGVLKGSVRTSAKFSSELE